MGFWSVLKCALVSDVEEEGCNPWKMRRRGQAAPIVEVIWNPWDQAVCFQRRGFCLLSRDRVCGFPGFVLTWRGFPWGRVWAMRNWQFQLRVVFLPVCVSVCLSEASELKAETSRSLDIGDNLAGEKFCYLRTSSQITIANSVIKNNEMYLIKEQKFKC